jgi:hypothetical protein
VSTRDDLHRQELTVPRLAKLILVSVQQGWLLSRAHASATSLSRSTMALSVLPKKRRPWRCYALLAYRISAFSASSSF